MVKTILILLLLCLIGIQCRVAQQNLGHGMQLLTDRMVLIPIGTGNMLKDAVTRIYAIDMLPDKAPVKMKLVSLQFYNRRDTIPIDLDNITVWFSGDSLKADSIKFPKLALNKVTDTMRCTASFFFSTPIVSAQRCLAGRYLATKDTSLVIEKLHPCQ